MARRVESTRVPPTMPLLTGGSRGGKQTAMELYRVQAWRWELIHRPPSKVRVLSHSYPWAGALIEKGRGTVL